MRQASEATVQNSSNATSKPGSVPSHRGAVRTLSLGATALAWTAALAASATACGARGPLDDTPLDSGASLTDLDASPSADDDASTRDGAATKDGGRDAGPADDSPLACGGCLASECGTGFGACMQSTTCRSALQCIATSCLGGGGQPDPACAFTCANGDMKTIASLMEVMQCVTDTCGGSCASSFESLVELLGTLGELGADGGALTGRPDGGRPDGGRPDGGTGPQDGGMGPFGDAN